MKMIIAIIQSKDANALTDKLTAKRYGITRVTTSGGFLRESSATLLIGVEDHQVNDVLAIIKATSQTRNRYISPMPQMHEPGGEIHLPTPIEVQVGGATIFVLEVDKYLRL